MKQVCALLATVALSVVASACGGAGKGGSGTSQAASRSSTAATAHVVRRNSFQAESITAYGHEAAPADKQAITALVTRYYSAAAADNGAAACALIYSTLSESVAEDYGQAPGPASLRGKTCTVVMSKLFRQVPGQPAAVLATTEVTGVRVKGRKGYALLRSEKMPEGDLPVERELGTWKIGALIGVALPGSEAPAPSPAGPGKTSPPNYDEPGVPKVKDADDGDGDPSSNDDEPVLYFGHAASEADEKAIVTLVKRFYTATSVADGPAICSLIYDVIAEGIPESYEQSPGLRGDTCGEIMAKVFAQRRRQTIRDRRKLKVTMARVEGVKGIAMVYLGKHPEQYFLVHRQGGRWKMLTLFTTGLP